MCQKGRYLFTCGLMLDPSFVSKCAFCSQDSKAKKKELKKASNWDFPQLKVKTLRLTLKLLRKRSVKLWLGLNEAAKLAPSVEGPLPSTTKEASYYFCFACIFMIFFNKGKTNLFVLILSGYIPKVCLS